MISAESTRAGNWPDFNYPSTFGIVLSPLNLTHYKRILRVPQAPERTPSYQHPLEYGNRETSLEKAIVLQ